MKKLCKLLPIFLILSLLMAVGVFASAEPAAEAYGLQAPATANHADVSGMTASQYPYITNYTNRDNTGSIYIGNDVTASADIALDDTVTGAGYTAVYAHGENAVANVSGVLVATDDTAGENASDFNGQGSLLVANDGAAIHINNASIFTDGFERSAIIVAQQSTVTAHNSDFTVLGANPLTEAYPEYVNSANQNIMLSPPWVLGIQGGARVVNMIGKTPTLNLIDCELIAGGWALISTDSGQNMMINVVDTEMSILPESEGGMDSGWRILGFEEDAYGSGYGAYYIGNPVQNYYGVTMDGVTYAAIITGATSGLYTSSEGEIDIYDANGNLLETVEGEGNTTTINGVFGVMMHNSLSDGMVFNKGTAINTENATIIYKAGNGDFYFDDARLNAKNDVIFQMIDNDDDSRVGMISMAEGFSTDYDESKVNAGDGFPGINYEYASGVGGNTLTATYTNGFYSGNIYNGTGYYGQKGDDLTVTLGENAVLNGNIALTSTIKAVPYSQKAMEGIAYYGDEIGYILLDAEGNVTENEDEAAYIQFKSYTINQYFLQGIVENKNHYNGSSTIEVVVEPGAIWNVTGESLITGLTVAEGAIVKGIMTENEDGSITIAAGAGIIPAGSYGSIEAVGGGTTIGGGLDATGALNVEAAAGAMADMQSGASGEPSQEPAASEEPAPSEEPVVLEDAVFGSFDVTVRVNGVEFVIATVETAVKDGVYSFAIGELLDTFDVDLAYDEENQIASLSADEGSLVGALVLQALADGAEPAETVKEEEPAVSGEPSQEPAASQEPTASQEPAAAAYVQPATEAEYEAYEAYIVEYMTAYAGMGDGTFDDAAREMAIGELEGVSFGSDVYAFPFEMYVNHFGAMDYAAFAADVAPMEDRAAITQPAVPDPGGTGPAPSGEPII